MVRHTFMATVEGGTPDEATSRKMDEMRVTKDSIPAIQVITVARNLGQTGPANVVTMTIDVKDRAGLNTLFVSPVRCEVADKAVEVSRTDSFVMAQIELQSVS